MKQKPKPNMETLQMREACRQLDQFTRRYDDWLQGKSKQRPHPEELIWPMAQYTTAWDVYRLGYAKNPPF